MIENEVNYRTWLLVGAHEFPAFHQAFDELLTPFFKIPITLCLLLSLILIIFKPVKSFLMIYIINFIILVYFVTVSLLIQVPIHHQLNEGHATDLIEQLIHTNTLYRLPAVIVLAMINIYLLYASIKKSVF